MRRTPVKCVPTRRWWSWLRWHGWYPPGYSSRQSSAGSTSSASARFQQNDVSYSTWRTRSSTAFCRCLNYHHHHHHTRIYRAPITIIEGHRCITESSELSANTESQTKTISITSSALFSRKSFLLRCDVRQLYSEIFSYPTQEIDFWLTQSPVYRPML